MINRVCVICGKRFKVFPRTIRNGHGLYCSLQCKGVGSRSKKSVFTYKGYNVYEVATGYYMLVLGRSNERLFHVFLMEEHLGKPLPKGYEVHHIDGNKHNNNIENLELVTRKEHCRKHADLRLKAYGGVPGRDKYCADCKTVKLLDDFPKDKTKSDGRHGFCKACSCRRSREYKLRKKYENTLE